MMLIVDAHLDLSYNALRGREVTKPAREQVSDGPDIPTVGLPDLHAGRVQLICATIFCAPARDDKPGYHNADEAHAEAQRHLDWYQRQVARGTMKLIRSGQEIDEVRHSPNKHAQNAILLMEGTDPLRNADDVAKWHAAGLRIAGLAWKRTRHAGGTGEPGPLTAEGIELVKMLDHFGIIHDISHLAEEAFWQLLDISSGPVIASHSNCRSIVPTDRQLSDEMIRVIALRGGVIGINFFDRFLLPPDQYGKRRATLTDVVNHMKHVCNLTGSAKHVAIGTDMDGGLGRNEIPVEIETSADLPRIADALSAAGFPDVDITAVLGENWLRCFRRNLPCS